VSDPCDQAAAQGRRLDRAVTALLGATCFALYAAGACPTIFVGDSGELVAAAYTLGIPHPSGYPLYVLLGKAWTLLVPVGSVAWRMSLLSAAAAAAAVCLMYRLARAVDLERAPALLAATLLGCGPSFWSQATIQRVYSLNAALLLAATLLAVRWQRSRRPTTLVAAFFVCGLGAANHTYMALFGAALAAWAVLDDRRVLGQWRTLLGCAGGALLGLAPYLYLPLRSRADPRLDWGDPETLGRWLDVILRRSYWDRAWLEGPRDLLPILGDYLSSLGIELAWGGAMLAVVALVGRRQHRLPLLLLLAAMAANLLSMAMHGSHTDLFVWHRYYIPSYALAALLAAAGAQVLARPLPRAAPWALLLLPAVLAATGWRAFDRSRFRVAEDYSRQVLAAVAPGGHLIASNDNVLFPLVYLQLVEGVRPDVDLILQGMGASALPPLKFRPESDPVYLTHHPNWSLPGLEIVAVGPVFQVWRPELPPLRPQIRARELEGERNPRVPKDFLTRNLIGDFHFMLGLTLEGSDWPAARRQLDLAASWARANDVMHYNLGLVFRRNGLLDEAREAFLAAHRINPRPIDGASHALALDRVRELDPELAGLARLRAELVAADSTLAAATPGSAAWHRRLADLLAARGEPLAARGHRLRAEEAESL